MPHLSAGWHPLDIIAALKKRHGTLAAVADAWGYDRSAIGGAIYARRGRSMAIEARIAQAIETTPHELWPDRWSVDGQPIQHRRTHPASVHPSRECQIRKAA